MTFSFNRVTFEDQFQRLKETGEWLNEIGIQTQNTRFDEILQLNKEVVEHYKDNRLEVLYIAN